MHDVGLGVLDESTKQAELWLKELAHELGGGDRVEAHRVLTAVLQAIRDGLTVEEAAAVAVALPTLIRGLYYEGWEPAKTPQALHNVDAFLRRVAEDAHLAGETEASLAVAAVVRVLLRHASGTAADDATSILPGALGILLEI